MATLTVKNIPDDLYREIKKKAKFHRRSLNSEIIHCLEYISGKEAVDVDSLIEKAGQLRKKVSGRLTEKEVNVLKRAGRP